MSTMITIARLQLLQVLNGRKTWLLVFLAFVPALLSIAITTDNPATSRDPLQDSLLLFFAFPNALCIFFALLYGSSIITADVDWNTLTYLFTRPIPKSHIVLGKYLGVVGLNGAVLLASLTLCWVLLAQPGGVVMWLAIALATVIALVAYTAMFAAFGVLLPRRAIAVALVYVSVFEFVMSYFPALVRKYSVAWHCRSLVLDITGIKLPAEMSKSVGDATLELSILVPVFIALVSLLVCVVAVQNSEFAPRANSEE